MRPRPIRLTALLLALTLAVAAAPPSAAAGTVVVTMSRTSPAVSGQPFTFTPHYANGWVVPPDTVCSWELRWGDAATISNPGYVDETFGSVDIRGTAADGFCRPWTFRLPYSASARWIWSFGMDDGGTTFYDVSSFEPGPGLPILSGSNGIPAYDGVTSSNLPGVWLSMPTGAAGGDTVTATAHPFGGYVQPPNGAHWDAMGGTCYCERIASTTNHAMTFTFLVTKTGVISVFYNDTGESTGDPFAGAAIDPRIRTVLRVALKVPLAVKSGAIFNAYAYTFGFRGTVTFHWYLDRNIIVVNTKSSHRYYLVKTGQRLISVIAKDAYGHRASRYVWVTVRP
jgi:hypothetical protein